MSPLRTILGSVEKVVVGIEAEVHGVSNGKESRYCECEDYDFASAMLHLGRPMMS
jgi:hypothetical protein